MEDDLDEWDPSSSSFGTHAAAGSIAGLAEHLLVFPADTVKTLMQARNSSLPCNLAVLTHAQQTTNATNACSCLKCISWINVAYKITETFGVARLWRGVQTVFTGCIPAHGAYFTIYETAKPYFNRLLSPRLAGGNKSRATQTQTMSSIAAGAAVLLGTIAHDLIMTPIDVCKQRMQLGCGGRNALELFSNILRQEGPRAFLVSFPTTLFMNVPYALVMGTSNEKLRQILNPSGEHSVPTYMLAGAGAGALAAIATNPLDVVKTRLQLQNVEVSAMYCKDTCPKGTFATPQTTICRRTPLLYRGMSQAAFAILSEEGLRGFTRGASARVFVHIPAVAISWTTYESVKVFISRMGGW